MMRKSAPRHTNSTVLPFSALILATAIWAAAVPVIKITVGYIPPITFLFIRLLLVTILMLPVMFYELKKTKVDPRDYKNLFILGVSGQTSLALIFVGTKYTTALDAGILGIITPITAILAGHYFYRDRLDSMVKLGVLIATVGMAVITFEPILINGTHSSVDIASRMFGNVMVLLYGLAFTAYIVWSKVIMGESSVQMRRTLKIMHVKPMRKAYSPLLHTGITFYVGMFTLIPFVYLENAGYFGHQVFSAANLSITPILGILYMAILSSIVAYIAFEWGLKKAHVTDSAIFGYLGPIFTIPFAYFMLGEIPTNMMLLGSTLIAIGVVIAEKHKG